MASELTNTCLLCGSGELLSNHPADRTSENDWNNLCEFYQIDVNLKDVINTLKTSVYCSDCLTDLQFVCQAYNKTDADTWEQLRLKEIQSNHRSKLQNAIQFLISNPVDLQTELYRVELIRRNELLLCMEVEPNLDAKLELEGSNEVKVEVRTAYYTPYLHSDDPPSCHSPLFSDDVDVKPDVVVAHEATVTPISKVGNSKPRSAIVTRIPRNTSKIRSKLTNIQQSPKSKSTSKLRVDRKETIHISNKKKISDLKRRFNLKPCLIKIRKLVVSDEASGQESHPDKREPPEPEQEALPFTNAVESENTKIVNDSDDDDPDEEIDSETLAELERRYNLNEFSYDIRIIPDPPKPSRGDGEHQKRSRSLRIIKNPARIRIKTQEVKESVALSIDDSDGEGDKVSTSSDSSASGSGSDSDDESETESDSHFNNSSAGKQKQPKVSRKIPDQRPIRKTDRAGNIIEPKFKCDTCPKQFFSNRELLRHVNVHANPEDRPSFKCSHCDKTYTTKSHCRIHEETHDPSYDKNKRFPCPICDQTFSDRKILRMHTRTTHNVDLNRSFKCGFLNCKRGFRDSDSLQFHFNTHHLDVRPFPCDVCKREFKTQKSLTLHGIHKHSGSKDHVCCFCGKGYPCARSLKTHEKRHDPNFRPTSTAESDRLCDLCGAVLRSKNSMEKHMRLVHNRNPYSDSEDTNNVNSLVAPSALQKKFICKYCEEAFVLQSTMSLHQQREHSEKFQFQCEECKFGASSTYLMEHHKFTKHSTARNFKCELCGNDFRAPKDLSRHMQAQHPASKKHKCPECDEAFVYKCKLKEHALMAHKKVLLLYGRTLHAARAKGATNPRGDESYDDGPPPTELSCEMCNRKYASELSLRRHNIKFHGTKQTSGDGVENFKCDQCPCMFTCKKNLVYHQKIHDEEYVKKRLTCLECGRTFSSPDTVRKHMEYKHLKQDVKK